MDIPKASIISNSKTIEYNFQSRDQYDLFAKSQQTNLDHFYFTAIHGILLFISFIIVGIICIISQIFQNTNMYIIQKIFIAIFVLYLFYFTIYSYYLSIQSNSLKTRVENEIPYVVTYRN
jgi:type IV secretory pathway VirB6-like protein